MSEVYHVKDFDSRREDRPEFPKDFKLVAFAITDDLERAYFLTNHIDKAWTENFSVVPIAGPHRSTSVGDVVVTSEGVHEVAAFGFDKLEHEPPEVPGYVRRKVLRVIEDKKKAYKARKEDA